MNQISIQKYRPFRYCDYLNGSNLVGSEYYPELQPTNIIPDKVIGFNEKNSVKDPSNYYLDHFIDDYHSNRFGVIAINILKSIDNSRVLLLLIFRFIVICLSGFASIM